MRGRVRRDPSPGLRPPSPRFAGRGATNVLLLLLLGCDPVVRKVVTLTFDETGEHVIVSATTYVSDTKAGTPEHAEAEEQRSALIAERDDWSVRFAQAGPETERVTLQRTRGRLESVQRSATVRTEVLQKFFFDTPISVNTTRGEGWMELNIYAGASTRATPAQRRLAEKLLAGYSKRAANYFSALRTMYLYLDEKPQRATPMFIDVFDAHVEPATLLSDDERSMTAGVRDAIDAMLENPERGSPPIDQILDLVYNPFPAQFNVIVKGEVLTVEGFQRLQSDAYEIRMPTAIEAVAALEGQWVSPDPLALAADKTNDKKTASELASMIDALPRRTTAVVSQMDLTNALTAKLRPAPRYRLRWVTTVRR